MDGSVNVPLPLMETVLQSPPTLPPEELPWTGEKPEPSALVNMCVNPQVVVCCDVRILDMSEFVVVSYRIGRLTYQERTSALREHDKAIQRL
jgi:hypothetical protein